jgi:hypothetical protein
MITLHRRQNIDFGSKPLLRSFFNRCFLSTKVNRAYFESIWLTPVPAASNTKVYFRKNCCFITTFATSCSVVTMPTSEATQVRIPLLAKNYKMGSVLLLTRILKKYFQPLCMHQWALVEGLFQTCLPVSTVRVARWHIGVPKNP